MRHRNTHALSVPKLPHNWRQCLEIVIGARRNMHKHVFTMIKSRGSLYAEQ